MHMLSSTLDQTTRTTPSEFSFRALFCPWLAIEDASAAFNNPSIVHGCKPQSCPITCRMSSNFQTDGKQEGKRNFPGQSHKISPILAALVDNELARNPAPKTPSCLLYTSDAADE